MKHLRVFEEIDYSHKYGDIANSTALYFEDILEPLKEDGFIECLYSEPERYNTLFTFYFELFTDEEVYDKFYNFLKEYKLEVDYEKVTVDNRKYEINIYVSTYKLKKFANFYDSINKYNL